MTIKTRFPSIEPSLDLNFAATRRLDPRITFTRASSATFVNEDGLIEAAGVNQARFDHTPTTGESLGLLVEEQRTNLVLYSQAINVANWGSAQATTQTLNAATSPDGNSNATLLVENTQNANRFIGQAIGVTNTAHTVSIFAKAKERRRIMFRESSVSGTSATFDLQSGTVVGSEGSPVTSIQPYGNGWYRCVMTYTPSSTSTRLHSVYLMPDSGTSFATSTYTGDGTSGLFLFGFHVEAGAFPTSYIPTTTAAATRSADVASITGTAFSSWYRQDEGTLFNAFSIPTSSTIGGARVYSIANSGPTTQVWLRLQGGTNRLYEVTDSSVQQAVLSAGTFSAGVLYRGAVALKTNDFGFSENGSTPTVDNSGTLGTVDRMGIGMDASGIAPLNGHIRRITYWPARLGNEVLQRITQ